MSDLIMRDDAIKAINDTPCHSASITACFRYAINEVPAVMVYPQVDGITPSVVSNYSLTLEADGTLRLNTDLFYKVKRVIVESGKFGKTFYEDGDQPPKKTPSELIQNYVM